MIVFLDTNIILDVLLERETFYKDSLAVLSFCENEEHEGWVSLLSIANIYYIGSRKIGKEKALQSVRILMQYLNVSDGNKSAVLHALESDFTDFEDALQNACALKISSLDAIVTRNTKDFKRSSIPFYTPSEFVKMHLGKI